MAVSFWRRVFPKEIKCPVCGCGYKWAIDPVAGTLYCYNTNINDPALMCKYEYQKEQVLSPIQIIIFNRLVQITRLFVVR